jgi:hypothetical protein
MIGEHAHGRCVALMLSAILLGACVGPRTAASSPSQPASAGNSSTPPAPTPSPTERPVVRATLIESPHTVNGRRGTVLVDHLEVRDFAGSTFPLVTTLDRGTEALLTAGPLSSDGLDWYEVEYGALPGSDPQGASLGGWVAAGPTGGAPTALDISLLTCPAEPTASDIGSMSELARLECLGDASYAFTGIFAGSCTDYYPAGEPTWLNSFCPSLLTAEGAWTELYLFFPPDVTPGWFDVPDLATIRVVGHVNDPAAETCVSEPWAPDHLEVQAERYRQACRSLFVVSEIEITG